MTGWQSGVTFGELLRIQQELYGGGAAFIGYPVEDGSGTAVDYRASAVAVNAKKENQASAWAFVKYYLLNGYDGQGFPVVQEQFDQVMREAMEDEYTTENGERKKVMKAYYNDGGTSISIYAASKEDVDAVTELVEQADQRFELHPAVQSIINEEAEAYFAGQVDLDRTAEKIQNRVSLLLQESR